MSSLAGVLPQTAAAHDQLREFATTNLGIDFSIADDGGFRDQSDTTRILAIRDREYQDAIANGEIPSTLSIDRWRPIAPFGHSYHNYGAAFDVAITRTPTNESDALEQLGAVAPQFGLRWGGGFTNPDPYHFELAIPIAEARADYANYTGNVPGDVAGGDTFAYDDSGEAALEADSSSSSSATLVAFLAIGAIAALIAFARRV